MRLAKDIIAESAIANAFSIERLEQSVVDGSFTRLSYHRILLVEEGTGTLTIDNRLFEIKKKEVYLMSKGQIYQFGNSSTLTGYLISFGDCFWDTTPRSASNCKAVLFNNSVMNQRLPLNNVEFSELCFLCRILLTEHNLPQYINQMDAVAAYLKIIMIKLANVKITDEAAFDSQDYLIYRKFMELLSAEFRTRHSVRDYADMINITSRRLSELCKRCCGSTAKEIINGQIIAEAKRYLQFSAKPVKEIAYELNFSTSEQFSHFFKKNTTIAPADYRNQFIKTGI